ncbi:MAG: aldo/keto reductase, partial [Anaerolineae bacterium]|nr:aldo/keto reductase [Anaerolineae bacterium]
LFQGLLTDSFKAQEQFNEHDVRSSNPKLNGEAFQSFYQIREKLLAFSAKIHKPLSQIAINWLIAQPQVTSVICGAQTVAHVEENAAAATWELTQEMLAEIEQILQPHHDLIHT